MCERWPGGLGRTVSALRLGEGGSGLLTPVIWLLFHYLLRSAAPHLSPALPAVCSSASWTLSLPSSHLSLNRMGGGGLWKDQAFLSLPGWVHMACGTTNAPTKSVLVSSSLWDKTLCFYSVPQDVGLQPRSVPQERNKPGCLTSLLPGEAGAAFSEAFCKKY